MHGNWQSADTGTNRKKEMDNHCEDMTSALPNKHYSGRHRSRETKENLGDLESETEIAGGR